jgi:DNA helicase-2/ATP-dependent DNA helicase PcrA
VLRPARGGGERPRILQFQNEAAEAAGVVGDLRNRLAGGFQPRDFAILFRTNEQPRPFEAELRKAKLPYVLVGGQSFFDRKEVRDILAYLKVLVSPGDEVSLRRIINTPPRGIGAKAQELLVAQAVEGGTPLWEALCSTAPPGVSPATADSILRFRQLVEEFRRRAAREPLVDVATNLIRQIGYQDELARTYKEPLEQQARWAAVEEVVNTLGAYQRSTKRPTLAGFLDEVAVGDRDSQHDKDDQLKRNAIALLTLHSAKGLEFPQVYLVGMEEGLLPHKKSIEVEGAAIDEERRLCYVGITRARDRLTISLALARMKWGKPRPTQPSRFLYELSGQADSATRRDARSTAPSRRPRATKKPPPRKAAARVEHAPGSRAKR